ncbi:MAG: hypothetical protein ACI9GH_000296 [Candidatus Paceibacteria bacterium]|jgi:hypothetical protein
MFLKKMIVIVILGIVTLDAEVDRKVKFSVKNWQTTIFADSKDKSSGDRSNSTGSVTGERLWGLDTNTELFCAFPMNRNLPKGATPIRNNKGQLRGKYLLITNPDNGKSVKARIVDRGPGKWGVLDLSRAVKRKLGFPVNWKEDPKKDRVNAILVTK